jgi:hypothetical protein
MNYMLSDIGSRVSVMHEQLYCKDPYLILS